MKFSLYIISIVLFISSCDYLSNKNKNEEVDVIENTEINFSEETEVFNYSIVETQPIYPGCGELEDKSEKYNCFESEIMELVKDNFTYPDYAKENEIEGRVIVSFVVSKSCKIKDIKVLRGVHESLDQEAVRLVSLIPQMAKPALQRGVPVPVSFVLPVTFKLDNNKKADFDYKIYPNPAVNYLNIEIVTPDLEIVYQILDLNGQIIKFGDILFSEERIEVYDLDKGTYIVRLIDNKNNIIKTEKILVK